MPMMILNQRSDWVLTIFLVVLASIRKIESNSSLAFQASHVPTRQKSNGRHVSMAYLSSKESLNESSDPLLIDNDISGQDHNEGLNDISRRNLLISLAAAATFLPLTAQAMSDESQTKKSLEYIELGEGEWTKMGRSGAKSQTAEKIIIPTSFATYASRFLINYDEGVASWWSDLDKSYGLLSEEQRSTRLGRDFGSLAASIQLALNSFVTGQPSLQQGYEKLLQIFCDKYSSYSDAERHIGILFAILPQRQQPAEAMQRLLKSLSTNEQESNIDQANILDVITKSPPLTMTNDLSRLLPESYRSARVDGSFYSIQPPISLYEVGIGEEFGQTAVATPFGPLSSAALSRQLPDYSLDTYTLFGASGAAGCALTHSIVIPLDVVKTKAQTDPENYSNVFAGASRIVEEEGIQGLLIGAQATLAGYFWYGLSVYPSYAFFKRFIGQSLLPPDFSVAHTNGIALAAGALASVIASLGLTPLEAARIRVVANPERYKTLGLFGTLEFIASEDSQLGWKKVYAGLPSLMTRQVIFGSIKFLAFERACEAIYAVSPSLRDATWTALTVSLVAGGFSGTLSAVVSQPADAVLTYVAQKSDGKGTIGVIEGCQLMIEESGASSLFRGVGSRCLWAGSIIAGQFLLYDVFRNFFGVNGDDLSQVFQVSI